jgi:hypothetical protein
LAHLGSPSLRAERPLRAKSGRGLYRGSLCASSDLPSSGVNILWSPAMRWLVSLARSVRSLICSSLTPICVRKNSFSPSRRDTYWVATCRGRSWSVEGPERRSSWPLSKASRAHISRDTYNEYKDRQDTDITSGGDLHRLFRINERPFPPTRGRAWLSGCGTCEDPCPHS